MSTVITDGGAKMRSDIRPRYDLAWHKLLVEYDLVLDTPHRPHGMKRGAGPTLGSDQGTGTLSAGEPGNRLPPLGLVVLR